MFDGPGIFNSVIQLIQQALRPYDDQFATLTARVEELERRVRNTIQPGKVIEVDAPNARVKVQFGENQTPWIRWFAPSAGHISEYRCPSEGEQCALINYGGGDNSSQSWALCGIWSDKFPPPDDANSADLHIIDWGKGLRLEINREQQTVNWKVPNGMTFESPDLTVEGNIHADENIVAKQNIEDFVRTMQDDRDIYNVHKNGPKTTPPSPSK